MNFFNRIYTKISQVPSRILIASIFAIIILTIAGFSKISNIDFSRTSKNNEQNVLDFSTSTAFYTASNIDTDGDGIKDWEESVWGTDPKNADTDGDGTTDGAEISMSRDPRIAGPNDSMTTSVSFASSTLDGSTTTLKTTLSDKLSQELFTQYMSNQQNGEVSDVGREQIVSNVLGKIDVPSTEPIYSITSIHTFTPKNNDELKQYGNEIIEVTKKELAKFASRDQSKLLSNTEIIVYKNVAEKLSLISVPKVFATTHVEILNTYNAQYESLKNIASYQEDPLKGLLGIKTYQALEAHQLDLFKSIATYFQKNGIIFDENEQGFAWENLKTLQ